MKFIKITLFIIFNTFICFNCTSTLTESEEKSNNQINVSEGILKHKKIKMHLSEAEDIDPKFIQMSNIVDQSDVSNNNLKNEKLIKDKSTEESCETKKLEEGKVLFSGWIKYFKYSDENEKFPRTFFINRQFYKQQMLFPKANLNLTSSDGVTNLNVYIKSPLYFYSVVFKNNINILSSRQTKLYKTYDVLNIDGIKPVMETEGFGEPINNTNGIQDFGSFAEGFCFKLLMTKPKFETWVLCTDNEDQKTKFMTILKNRKLETQRKNGLVNIPVEKVNQSISNILNSKDADCNSSKNKSDTRNVKNGNWVVLQDWTQCSLKCGGGTSTLQRMCVPPRNGGLACEGQPIITRPCNTQPCPDLNENESLFKSNNNTTVLKPVVKVLPFFVRPQRFSKCVIKESDLMLIEEVEKIEVNPLEPSNSRSIPKQIPVRVIMNTKTLTIFSGESYDSQIKTFAMETTILIKSSSNQNCFVLKESNKRAELCPFGYNPKGKNIFKEWFNDFDLFKNKCYTLREKTSLDNQLELDKELDKKLQEKIQKAKKELLEEREKQVKNKIAKQEENQMEKVITNTNEVAYQAIQKEMNLEMMIKKEEEERELREEIQMKAKIEEEKKKSECFMKAIKERELENQNNIKTKEVEDEVSSIRKAANQQVLIRRNQLKDQILQMRKKAQIRKSQLANELLNVRTSMAETMGKAYKKGDISKCQTALKSKTDRNNYCMASFPEDYNAMINCKEGDEFCSLCCETEYGEMNINDREKCYKTACATPATESKPSNGRWVWQEEIK